MIQSEEIVTRLSLVGRAAYSAELAKAQESVAEMSTSTAVLGRAALTTEKGLGFFSAGISKMIGFAKMAVIGVGVLAVGIAYLGTKFISSAADADKAHDRYVAVFQSLTSQTDGFIQNLQEKFGVPTNVLESGIAQFGRLAESVGIARDKLVPFTESLVQASVDLASFYNLDPAMVMQQVQRGVAGQMRGLKALGIVIRETDVTARAAEMGFGKHADEGTRMMIRQQMIMQQIGVVTKNLQNDSGTLANQQWQLKGRMQELEITAGRLFIPLALLAVTGLNKLLIPATRLLAALLPSLRREFAATGPVVQALQGPLSVLSDGFDALITGGPMALVDWLDTLLNDGGFFRGMIESWISILGSLWIIFKDGVLPVLHDFAPLVGLLAIPLHVVDVILGFLADHMTLTKVIVALLVVGFIAWTLATWAQNIALATLQLIVIASRAPMYLMIAAEWAHAAVLTVETAATWALSAATWAALLPYIALIALFIVVAVATYMLLDHFDQLRDGAVQAFGDIEDAGYRVAEFMGGIWFGMVDGVKAAFNIVLDYLESGINLGIDLLNQVITGINHIPGVYINHIDEVTLPRLHSGGTVVAPGLANIRPDEEIIHLPGGATVVPLSAAGSGVPERPSDMRPMLVQLVTPDRKVLAEIMVDGNADTEARR